MRRFALLSISLFAAACSSAAARSHTEPSNAVARGEFLVRVGGCEDCHTPLKLDPKIGMPVRIPGRMLSGHPDGAPDPRSSLADTDQAVIGPTFTSFRLPFGVVYAANLTPDKETGLGSWTEEMFVRAFRTGRHFGGTGRPILPPMPWANLAALPDSDLKAIFAYLGSIPPVHNGVPSAKVPQAALDAILEGYTKLAAQAKR
jgi:hypothetical protein